MFTDVSIQLNFHVFYGVLYISYTGLVCISLFDLFILCLQTVRVWQGSDNENYNCRHILKDHTAEVYQFSWSHWLQFCYYLNSTVICLLFDFSGFPLAIILLYGNDFKIWFCFGKFKHIYTTDLTRSNSRKKTILPTNLVSYLSFFQIELEGLAFTAVQLFLVNP